jgi:hypothetical protein
MLVNVYAGEFAGRMHKIVIRVSGNDGRRSPVVEMDDLNRRRGEDTNGESARRKEGD